jgi:hypothetical protein
METQQEKNRSYKSKKNAAHGLRDLFEVGLKILLCRKNIEQNTSENGKNASTPQLVY